MERERERERKREREKERERESEREREKGVGKRGDIIVFWFIDNCLAKFVLFFVRFYRDVLCGLYEPSK